LPDELGAQVGLGHLAERGGDRAAALAHFRAALASAPGHIGLRLEVARILAALGQAQEAEHQYCATLAADPHNLAALVGLGHLARTTGDREAALRWFREAAAAHPAQLPIALEIATELRDAGDFAQARAAVQEALLARPSAPEAWIALAQIERVAGDRPAAWRALQAALAFAPAHVGALLDCAVEERALGRAAASADCLRRARAIAPGDLGVLMLAADHAWLSDDIDAALAIYREAMATHPASPIPIIQAVRALAALGRMPEARDLLASCRLEHPTLAAARIELLRQLGDWAGARAAIPNTPPHDFELCRQICQLHLALGEFAALAETLDAAPARTPHQRADVLHLRAEHAEALWQLDEAAAFRRQALALNPDDAWTQSLAARLALLRLRLDEAATHLRHSVRLAAAGAQLRGESSNLSQSHLGQLFDEFRLDPAQIDQLRRHRADIPVLRALMQANPDHTPTAITLMIALRQAGRLTPAPAPTTPIPRRIVQFWDTPDPPTDILDALQSWPDHNPGWTYQRLDDTAARAFLAKTYAPDITAAYDRGREPAQKCDLFRLAWLYAFGGLYADADDRCLAPLDTSLPQGFSLIAYQEEYGTIGNNLLACTPRHPVIGRALRLAVDAINRGDADILWLATGPGLLTRAFAQEPPENALILERHALRRITLPHTAMAYKRTARHWVRGAFSREVRVEAKQRTAGAPPRDAAGGQRST